MKDLLTEKYRPDTIENYVFTDDSMKKKVMGWISNPQDKRIPIPNVLFAGSPGTGKAQGLENKILTEHGWVKNKDIKVGDKVVTPDGSLSLVTGVYPQGKKDLYTIIFEDGRSTQCCEEHLWKVFIDGYWEVLSLKDMTGITEDMYIPLVSKSVSNFCNEEDRVSIFRSFGQIPMKDDIKVTFIDNDKLKISKIEYFKNDEAQCIMIDHPDHLYITDDYLVTHNTTLAKILCNECHVEKGDILYINASRENNVDTVRNKIHDFCSTMPMGNYKVVILDECLSENEEIKMADGSYLKLKDMDYGIPYEVMSFNMDTMKIEKDVAHVISKKVDKLYEVELDDGRCIHVTIDHPFLVMDNDRIIQKKLADLKEGDYIVSEEIR